MMTMAVSRLTTLFFREHLSQATKFSTSFTARTSLFLPVGCVNLVINSSTSLEVLASFSCQITSSFCLSLAENLNRNFFRHCPTDHSIEEPIFGQPILINGNSLDEQSMCCKVRGNPEVSCPERYDAYKKVHYKHIKPQDGKYLNEHSRHCKVGGKQEDFSPGRCNA